VEIVVDHERFVFVHRSPRWLDVRHVDAFGNVAGVAYASGFRSMGYAQRKLVASSQIVIMYRLSEKDRTGIPAWSEPYLPGEREIGRIQPAQVSSWSYIVPARCSTLLVSAIEER
jgi:hypothetical protein